MYKQNEIFLFNANQIHLLFELLHYLYHTGMPVLQQAARFLVLLVPLIKNLFGELLLRYHQGSETLSSEIIAFVLNIPPIDRLSKLNHDHICSLQVEEDSLRIHRSHDDTHPLGIA